MSWKFWLIILLAVLPAGYMVFDGTRALVIGDYITPSTGEYAGQLGPWANLVKAIGIGPRSTFMKLAFIIDGLVSLTALAGFALKLSWGQPALIVLSILGLWYLPIGTFANILVLILLLMNRS